VFGVVPGSAAQVAGIEAGDIIRGVDGAVIETADAFRQAIREWKPGQLVSLILFRGEKELKRQITLGVWNGHAASSE
jgi:S1-C subfamily serine protease